MPKPTKYILSSLNESILNVVSGRQNLDEAASDLTPNDIIRLEKQVQNYLATKVNIRSVKLNFASKLNLKSPKPMEYDITSTQSPKSFKELKLKITFLPGGGANPNMVGIRIGFTWKHFGGGGNSTTHSTLVFDKTNNMKLEKVKFGS